MHVLVTGASGFVGPYLVRELLSLGYQVSGTGIAETAPSDLEKSVTYYQLEITEADQCRSVMKACQPDVVYHLAGIAFVPQAEKNFKQALEVNCLGTDNVLQALMEFNPKSRFILISSGEVYGAFQSSDLPLTEQRLCLPNNNYAISKLAAEKVVERFQRQKQIESVILRPFNHIGPGQSELFAVGSFSKQIAQIKLGLQEPKLKVGNLDVKIDFLDVRDVVRAYANVAERGEGIYNVCSGTSVSLRQIIATLSDIAGLQVEIEIDPERFRPAERAEILGSHDRLATEFNWKPEYSLKATLADCLDSWLKKLS